MNQEIQWSWVDFELGENIVNPELEAAWKDATIDGRKVLYLIRFYL